jgi:hypothetical protein
MAWFGKKDILKLNSYEELYSELVKRKHWKKLNVDIIRQIVKNAQSDVFAQPNEGIEVLQQFIYISEKHNIVKNNYVKIAETHSDLGVLLGLFSTTLYRYGSDFTKALYVNKKPEEMDVLRMFADAAFMSSILCYEFAWGAYIGMAVLHGSLYRNKNVGLEFCAKYRAAEEKLLSTPDNELDSFQLMQKEGLDPKVQKRTLNEIRKHVPRLLPNDLVTEDEEMSERDYIEQLEKELLQL